MSDTPLYLKTEGAIASLVLNRPDKKNAFTQAMWEMLPGLVAAAEQDPEVKVIVVKSAAPGIFCAGADIGEFEAIASSPERSEANRIAFREAQRSLAGASKPTIAAVDGPCVGGGCGLALCCDIRISTPTARFGITPVKLGLIYSVQDSKRLVDLVGLSQAKSILFTGRLVGAEEALRIGLVNTVVAAEALDAEVLALAQEIAANSQWGVRGIKRILALIADGAVDDTEETINLFRQSFAGPDHQEGAAAFLARRKPNFPYK